MFLGIPKNASTSIRESPIMEDCNRTTYSLLKEEINFDEYLTFTVLREPVERLVSGYYEVQRGNKSDNVYNTATGKKFIDVIYEPDRFLCFLEEIEEHGYFDSHIKPQASFLSDQQGNKIPVEHYLFFNNIGEDFAKLCLSRGFVYELPNRNGFAKPSKWRLQHCIANDERIINLIKGLYGCDIDLYNEKRLLLNKSLNHDIMYGETF